MDRFLRVCLAGPAAVPASQAAATRTHGLAELWAQGKPAFGLYAPNENPGPRGQRGQPPQPAVYTREGGSIPVSASFESILGLPVVLLGFAQPHENAHAPDEWMDLANYEGAIRAIVATFDEMAKPDGGAAE